MSVEDLEITPTTLPVYPDGSCILEDRNGWCDITIIAENECENTAMTERNADFSNFVEEKERKFYEGHEVDTWNFFLTEKGYNQVLVRHSFHLLKDKLLRVLKREGNIQKVSITHEQGAGGTTVAKHIVWDLRKRYRCAIVNKVTTETVEQIEKYRHYGSSQTNPGPVVLMIDNFESSDFQSLYSDLLDVTQNIQDNKPAFVLLQCERRNLPSRRRPDEDVIDVTHTLEEGERNWFTEKVADLEKKKTFSEVDSPEKLFAFMLMKHECKSSYVRMILLPLVTQLVDSQAGQMNGEAHILKYMAVLHRYNPRKRKFAMPAGSCNKFMKPYYHGYDSYRPWVAARSDIMKILLIAVSVHNADQDHEQGLVFAHPIIGVEIIQQFKTLFEQSLGDVVLQLFYSDLLDCQEIKNICRDLMVRRPKEHGGKEKTKYPPLIEEVYKEEGQRAFEVFQVGFECCNYDVFILQQKARLHSIAENDWDSAEEAINHALSKKSDNSYLWDTKGIILREKMRIYTKLSMTEVTMHSLISDFEKACEAFRECQKVMEREKTGCNYAGFVGEVSTVFKFLEIIEARVSPFDDSLVEMKKFIFTDYIPDNMNPSAFCAHQQTLRKLKARVHKILCRLNDYHVQCEPQGSKGHYVIRDRNIHQWLKDRNKFFVSDGNHSSEQEVRRARVMKWNADGFRQIFKLVAEEKVQHLKIVRDLLEENRADLTLFDVQNLVFASFALLLCGEEVDMDEMRTLVTQLKEMEKNDSGLYAMFFEMLLNWSSTDQRGAPSLEQTVRALRERWFRNYRQDIARDTSAQSSSGFGQVYQPRHPLKPRVHFFLGREDNFIVGNQHYYEREDSESVCKDEKMRHLLARLQGQLDTDGEFVNYSRGGRTVKIACSQSKKRRQRQRTVHFYLGFSFAGPIACDVS